MKTFHDIQPSFFPFCNKHIFYLSLSSDLQSLLQRQDPSGRWRHVFSYSDHWTLNMILIRIIILKCMNADLIILYSTVQLLQNKSLFTWLFALEGRADWLFLSRCVWIRNLYKYMYFLQLVSYSTTFIDKRFLSFLPYLTLSPAGRRLLLWSRPRGQATSSMSLNNICISQRIIIF